MFSQAYADVSIANCIKVHEQGHQANAKHQQTLTVAASKQSA